MPSKATAILRASSTLVLLRDGPQGLEVHLSRRNPALSFMGGAWVFPGGSVDPSDMSPTWGGLLQGAQAWYADGPLPPLMPHEEACAFLVAALRETVEEVGIVFADTQTSEREALRQAAQRGSLGDSLTKLGLRLDPSTITPWGRWVTPKAFPRRFDTVFFAAPCPPGQEPKVDGGELVEGRWLTPRAALELHLEGALPLAPPTLVSLQDLSLLGGVGELSDAVLGRDMAPACPFALDMTMGSRVLVMPGDKDHPEAPGSGLRRAVEIRPWVFKVEVG